MEFRTEIVPQANGAKVEVSTMIHEGREFTAMGSVIDHANGRVTGYVRVTKDGPQLVTFTGEVIAKLSVVSRWTQPGRWTHKGFYVSPIKMASYRAIIEGRTYHGRCGAADLLHMWMKVKS